MGLFPLCCNFEGDFVLQLVPVDSENTMDEVAQAAAHHSVGRRVKNQPNRIFTLVRTGQSFFARNMKVSESDLKPTECVEIIWE